MNHRWCPEPLWRRPGVAAGGRREVGPGRWQQQDGEFYDAIVAAAAEHPFAYIFSSFPGVGPVITV